MTPHHAQAKGPEITPFQADVLRWCEGLKADGLYPSVQAILARAAMEGAHPARTAVEKARKSLSNRHLVRLGRPDAAGIEDSKRKDRATREATRAAVSANKPLTAAGAPGPAPAEAPRRRLGPLAGLIREHREVLRRQRGGRP